MLNLPKPHPLPHPYEHEEEKNYPIRSWTFEKLLRPTQSETRVVDLWQVWPDPYPTRQKRSTRMKCTKKLSANQTYQT